MARWYGEIGYAETVETSPGVWGEQIVPHEATGDMLNLSRSLRNSGTINDNIEIGMELSIVGDPYALSHFSNMRYATYMGVKWKTRNVTVMYPRLNISLGEEYEDGGEDETDPSGGA